MKKLAAAIALSLLASLAARGEEEIIVKALVDGPSDFVITTNGFHWVNGANAKVGRHEGRNEPTYINGRTWYPRWEKNHEDRGVDSSDVYAFPLASLDLEFELLAVGNTPDTTTIEPRTLPVVTYGQDAVVISIPDPEASSRWYVFALVARSAGPR